MPLVAGEGQPRILHRRRDISPPAESNPGLSKKDKVAEDDVKVLEKLGGEAEQSEEVPVALVPSFTSPNVQIINSADSVTDDPRLAVMLLEGFCLLRDVKRLPTSVKESMAIIC